MSGLNSVYLLHHVTPEFSLSILLECGTEEDCIHVDRGTQYHEIIAILNVVVFLLTLYHQCLDGGSTL